ncbi:MAG: hypothetical protein ACK5NK_02305 [Niabella sp.]
MQNKPYSSKHPVVGQFFFLILMSILGLIVLTLSLPWYTQVIAAQNYLQSVSKLGLEASASLPVTLSLLALLFVIGLHPQKALTGSRLKIIFFSGLWIMLYSSAYFCMITATQYATPGFGTLIAIIGGIILMFVCVVIYTKEKYK